MGDCALFAQAPGARPTFDAFEVATVKPTPPDWRGGRYIRMSSPQRFVATNYTLRVLIGAAYNLTPTAILGGAAWLDSDHYDIVAATPGSVHPNLDQQMSMLRKLLADRFKLTFHLQEKEFPVYLLTVAKNGPKLRETTAPPDDDPVIVSQIAPGTISLPARNATMTQFATVMQRSIFDRPVLDKTGLFGRYDFDLEWTRDETQFDGERRETQESAKPGLFTAIQQQLGLRLEAARGVVQAIAIDRIERPSEN
jgi:uncharacterized protein (TIGR03435 family)